MSRLQYFGYQLATIDIRYPRLVAWLKLVGTFILMIAAVALGIYASLFIDPMK